jgi:hypothetical protein
MQLFSLARTAFPAIRGTAGIFVNFKELKKGEREVIK